MKLKEIIKDACIILELDDLRSGLASENISSETENNAKKFVNFFNHVEKEIAFEFLPVIKIENVDCEEQIYFEDLEEDVLDVIYIKNEQGKKLFFNVFPTHVSFDGTAKKILYSYLPEDFDLNDDVLPLVPKQVYLYGIAREYYMFEGLSDKAQVFEEKFKNSISSLIEKDKNRIYNPKRLPKRNWI